MVPLYWGGLLRNLALGLGFSALPAAAMAAGGGSVPCLIRPAAEIDIAVDVPGRVTELAVRLDQAVQAGQVLARQSDGPERALHALAERAAGDDTAIDAARARLDLLQAQAERMSSLSRQDLVRRSDLDSVLADQVTAQETLARAIEARARAALELDRARAELDRLTIRSPADGIITRIDIDPGEFGSPQIPLMRLSVLDPLHVTAYLPLEMHGRITPGDRLSLRPEPPVGGDHLAAVDVVDRVYDAASGTFGLRLVLPNPGGNIPGGIRCDLLLPAG